MKEELAISQGFGIMKSLNKSTEEKTVGEDESNTDKAKSGLSKLVCDRYPNIVAGRETPTFIFSHVFSHKINWQEFCTLFCLFT